MKPKSSSRPPEPSASEIERFFNALGDGVENAQTAEQLAIRLGYGRGENAKRRVRLLAEHAGDHEMPIIGDGNGYCRPAKPQDYDGMLARLGSQAKKMLYRLAQARRMRDRQFPGEQMDLFRQENP